jgi:hypothetical protein
MGDSLIKKYTFVVCMVVSYLVSLLVVHIQQMKKNAMCNYRLYLSLHVRNLQPNILFQVAVRVTCI